MPIRVDASNETRRTLLTRLKDWDDQEGWKIFFDCYWRLIFSVARRAGLNEADAQDIVQETVLAVAKQMPTFRYDPARGSFRNWLGLITRRKIIQHHRKRSKIQMQAGTATGESRPTAFLDRLPDSADNGLNQVWREEWERNMLSIVMTRLKKRVDPRHLQAYDFYVLKGWPVEKVEAALNVSASHIYTIKHRVSALMKEECERLEVAGF